MVLARVVSVQGSEKLKKQPVTLQGRRKMQACRISSLVALFATTAAAVSQPDVLLDMVQNNPGDTAMNFQSSKYQDPNTLAALNYTGQVSTGENAIALVADFHTVNDPSGRYV